MHFVKGRRSTIPDVCVTGGVKSVGVALQHRSDGKNRDCKKCSQRRVNESQGASEGARSRATKMVAEDGGERAGGCGTPVLAGDASASIARRRSRTLSTSPKTSVGERRGSEGARGGKEKATRMRGEGRVGRREGKVHNWPLIKWNQLGREGRLAWQGQGAGRDGAGWRAREWPRSAKGRARIRT